ncbi:MAG: CDP-4-dehydro-6-deoxyglucose reductase [Candidatus Azotimanducaceae bacterium]|jgi:CDP-4-dehydro-6-deoxyglucose reductase
MNTKKSIEPKIELSSGVTFQQVDGRSILESAESNGLSLAYSCRTGRCSTCKCQVISGDTVPLVDEIGLTQKEKDSGWILACVRSATSNLEIEVDDLGDVILPKPNISPCRINSIDKVSKHVVCVGLRLPPKSQFKVLAGQYIDIVGPAGVRRSYSVANYVTDNIIELHIGVVDNGCLSAYWFGEAKINDLLRLNGPLGTFFLRSIKAQDVVFLATGTGIAPINAMIESIKLLAPEDCPNSLTVFWGGRTLDDLYFDPSANCKLLRYVPVLSRSALDWEGQKGYVQDVFLNEHPDLSNCTVYACGSDNMIRSSCEILVKSGLPEKKFFSDAFLPSAPL